MSTRLRHDRQHEFLDLVEAHQGIVHKVCAVYSESPDEHEDLHQEILMQLWRSFPSFRGLSKFSTWMYRVALNTALLARRKKHNRTPTRPLSEIEPVATEVPAGPDSEVERLQRCIRELRELDRAVILLYLEQLPHEEIAELTGISRKNVGVRVVRIKERLRKCLLSSGSETR